MLKNKTSEKNIKSVNINTGHIKRKNSTRQNEY